MLNECSGNVKDCWGFFCSWMSAGCLKFTTVKLPSCTKG
jgi:hypothetical protein